jgi:hypothetical protein
MSRPYSLLREASREQRTTIADALEKAGIRTPVGDQRPLERPIRLHAVPSIDHEASFIR